MKLNFEALGGGGSSNVVNISYSILSFRWRQYILPKRREDLPLWRDAKT